MHILRVFNNNVVLARRGDDEVIVTGRGLGFKAHNGDEIDPQRVAQVFIPSLGRDPDHLAIMLAALSPDYIDKVVTALNSVHVEPELTLVVALADHIQSAVERNRAGHNIDYPLRAEVEHLYADDYGRASQVLALINAELDEPLPDSEAIALALHLVNAGFASGDLSNTYRMTGLIQQLIAIIGEFFGKELDTGEVTVARFITHLRYLFVRMQQHKQLSSEHSAIGRAIVEAYPRASECAKMLANIIELRMDDPLTDDEISYLALHVARLEGKA
ncbi:BglG family transcription antiterminator [Corynebacterium sp. L4756]|uniref:BglG family transcription antiterminator n=1 Tax=unclassified Corynebacterium TaxID=2624378 RepID=UPI00374CCB13